MVFAEFNVDTFLPSWIGDAFDCLWKSVKERRRLYFRTIRIWSDDNWNEAWDELIGIRWNMWSNCMIGFKNFSTLLFSMKLIQYIYICCFIPRSTNLNYSYNWINKSQSQFNYNFRIEASGNELFTNILIVYTTQRINNVTYKYNQIIRKLFFAWIMNIIQKLYIQNGYTETVQTWNKNFWDTSSIYFIQQYNTN